MIYVDRQTGIIGEVDNLIVMKPRDAGRMADLFDSLADSEIIDLAIAFGIPLVDTIDGKIHMDE